MKRRGRHPVNELTVLRIKSIKEPGRYADGNGLYLVVDKSGAKRWMLRTVVRGRRRDIGLGGIQTVSLAEAREKCSELLKKAKAGGDPLAQRRSEKAIPTFAEAAATVHQQHVATWKNKKHTAQWINTLTTYAFPTLGSRAVNDIETAHVLAALSPIWLSKPETARRVSQRVRTVLDWAKAAGFRSSENPVAGVAKGLPRQPDRKKHHAALPFEEVPAFVRSLRASENSEPAKLAFEFLILTATRTSEVLGLDWNELSQDVWTLPAERTKPKRELRIPLGGRCQEILRTARQFSDGTGFVFPGQKQGQPLSNMVFLMALRRLGLQVRVTGHGFRSSFTDWAHERTNSPHVVIEMALNHVIKDKTEAAYRRGDLFEKRRQLMRSWEKFVHHN